MMGLQMVLGIRRRSVNPAQELSTLCVALVNALIANGILGQLRIDIHVETPRAYRPNWTGSLNQRLRSLQSLFSGAP